MFKAKASVLSMYFPQRQWVFSTEIRGLTYSHRTPNLTGDGHAMAWTAGAVMAGVEASDVREVRALTGIPSMATATPTIHGTRAQWLMPTARRSLGLTETATS